MLPGASILATMSTPTLLGVPYDAASSFMRGSAAGPAKIREALHSPAGNPWSETLVDISALGVMQDAGDVDFFLGGDAILATLTGDLSAVAVAAAVAASATGSSTEAPIAAGKGMRSR